MTPGEAVSLARTTVDRARSHVRAFGVVRGLTNAIPPSLRGPVFPLRVPGTRTVLARAHSSDLAAFEEVFLREEYRLPPQAPPLPPHPFIVDAGANVGYASVYFATRYPEATVVAVEPEATNHALLVLNTRDQPGVHPVRAALWHSETHLALEDPGLGEWGYRVGEPEPEREPASPAPLVPAVTIPGLLRTYGRERIDLLKIDIEGAERDVLGVGADAWIDRVDVVYVELHDRFRPGCTAALEEAIAGRPFTRLDRGQSVILVRRSPQAQEQRNRPGDSPPRQTRS